MMPTAVPLLALVLASCTGGTHREDPAPALVAAEEAAARDPAPFDQSHAVWDAILRQHVHGGGFDYAALAKAPEPLYRYLGQLHAVTPEELAGWTREQRFAFWIDAYNAHTIQKVVENYPLESIRDLDKAFGLNSVFEQAWIPMEAHDPRGKGGKLSLNDIEHEILRARFQDARVHAAINCASQSCPPLLARAFVASELDLQLDGQMRAFVRDPARNRFDREEGVARLSEIFKWFAEDFERDAGSVTAYVARYAEPEDAAFLKKAKVRYLDYSWDLNEAEDG